MVRTKKQTAHKSTTGAKALCKKLASASVPDGCNLVTPGGATKNKRYRPGTATLRAIRKYQESPNISIRRALFHRIVGESTQDMNLNVRFHPSAVATLQVASEAFLTSLFDEDTTVSANLCTSFTNRVTISPKEMPLARRIRGDRA